MWDLAAHDISIFNYLLGEKATHISCVGSDVIPDNSGQADVCFATMRYGSGPIAHMHASWLNPQKIRRITIIGNKKMVVWDGMERQSVTLFDKHVDVVSHEDDIGTFRDDVLYEGGVERPRIASGTTPLLEEILHFINITNGKDAELVSDGQSGIDVVEALEAANRSMKSGGTFVPIGA